MITGSRFPNSNEAALRTAIPIVCDGCIVQQMSTQNNRIGQHCREVVLARLGAVSVNTEAPGGIACLSLETELIRKNADNPRFAARLALMEGFGPSGPARF